MTDVVIEDRPDAATGREPQFLRVKVVDHSKSEQPSVNVRLPLGVVKWGMKMAQTFSPEIKDADLDWDTIAEVVHEGAQGEIVHAEDEANHQTVEVWVE
ncbi:MAG: hypothetical protein ACJ761_11545 [Chloroflexota bacterium]